MNELWKLNKNFLCKTFTTHKKAVAEQKIYVPWSSDPPQPCHGITFFPETWGSSSVYTLRGKNMQMNCKFAIFMLVNICMRLFTTDVASVVEEEWESLNGGDYQVMVEEIKERFESWKLKKLMKEIFGLNCYKIRVHPLNNELTKFHFKISCSIFLLKVI